MDPSEPFVVSLNANSVEVTNGTAKFNETKTNDEMPVNEKRASRGSKTSESDVVYEELETVSLEASADSSQLNAHLGSFSNASVSFKREDVILEQPVIEKPDDSIPICSEGKISEDLSLVFTTPPQSLSSMDPKNFFDSLSAGMSPMMKSVVDITALEDKDSMELATDAMESMKLTCPEKIVDQTAALDETLQSDGKPKLKHLFEDDKFGSDVVGKAFFDTISALGESNAPFNSEKENFPEKIASPFSSPLHSPDQFLADVNERDQYYDAWIPSSKTRDTLIAAVTSPSGTFFPEKSELTMPGVIIEEILVDQIKVLMTEMKWDEAKERQCLVADNVPQDEKGLQQLINIKCYNAAVNLTTRLLTVLGQGPGKGGHPSRHSPYSLQLWYIRLALFIKLRKFSFAEVESEAFGNLDKADIYYEYYTDVYPGRKGSMAPFSFRLLLAELPQHQGNYHGALDRLYSLLSIVTKILENLGSGLAEDGSMMELTDIHKRGSLKLWQVRERRVLFSILNCMLAQKDYAMAIGVAKSLIQKDETVTAAMYTALGKIYLQLGDVISASECFTLAANERKNQQPNVKHQVEDLVNKALMCIVQNGYADAYKLFKEAYTLEPTNAALANNMAVCLLYMGKLKDSLATLEKTIYDNPKQCLHEGVLFNTCILYELESVNSMTKKEAMLRLAAKHSGDSFQTNCLKIDVANRSMDKRREV